jgi:hypothetical protein
MWTTLVGSDNGAGIWQSGGGLVSDGPGKEDVTVHVPVELPSLTTPVSRTLLAILIELTAVKILDAPPDRGRQ